MNTPEIQHIQFICKEDFIYSGFQIAVKNNNVELFPQNIGWFKDKVYSGKYYGGGVMCPVEAFMIKSEDGCEYLFTLHYLEGYLCFSEHFEIKEIQDFISHLKNTIGYKEATNKEEYIASAEFCFFYCILKEERKLRTLEYYLNLLKAENEELKNK